MSQTQPTVNPFAEMQAGRPTGPLVQGYEVIIGFETHTQLTTQSKIFSRASTAFGGSPPPRTGEDLMIGPAGRG